MKKDYDLAVKVGEKKDGKAVWKNVGAIMSGDKGPFILLDRTFNPAGVPGQDERQSVIVSMFRVKPKDDGPEADAFGVDVDEPIPF